MHEDDDNDDSIDREAPDESDIDDDETMPCPNCGKAVYDQAEICPHCGCYISSEDAPRQRHWWIWAGVILALLGLLWWVF